MSKPEISAIQEQIEEDDGVPGARARKNAQRASDANPVKGSEDSEDSEYSEYFEEDLVNKEAQLTLFQRLYGGGE